ncbi:hemagglutinin [Microbacterium sp. HMWF026]|uniref:hemagglutinin n=1 Tax=Microbacterium sp. HMWF026 TaxID=2056861 RepID=UPI0011B28D1D|nr:hemagglutinin [Microbacterium sp. HMWF026]
MAKTRSRRRRTARQRQLRRRRLAFGAVATVLVALIALAITPLFSLTAAWNTELRREAVDLSGFDPGTLISDEAFYDGDAMDAAQIQRFLDDEVGECRSDRCLARLTLTVAPREPVVSTATGETVCDGFDGGELTAAELIDRVQRACGISAKVLLVTLQKEQSLVSGRAARAPSDEQLGAAMGARCPDDAPCDQGASGFAEQVAQGATDLKSYSASDFMRQPGTHYIAFSPEPACGGTDVQITNEATAALYNYTPYQPNPAALAARWGTGDACSAYGNRNFALYWALWFG